MDEFEVTCKVTKGERDIAYGDDCYCYYTQPNYNERIVRCKDCKYSRWHETINDEFGEPIINGRLTCDVLSHSFFGVSRRVEQEFFCAWGERRDDA